VPLLTQQSYASEAYTQQQSYASYAYTQQQSYATDAYTQQGTEMAILYSSMDSSIFCTHIYNGQACSKTATTTSGSAATIQFESPAQ
jgi:type II secretory pathway pseudopilin PulG